MRLVLAGAQDPQNFELMVKYNAPNVLMSYWYLRKQADRGRSIVKRAHAEGMWLLIDSGAFTYKEKYCYLRRGWIEGGTEDGVLARHMEGNKAGITQATLDEAREKAGNRTREEVKAEVLEYWEEYWAWVQEMHPYFHAYAELDLDMLVDDVIWDWRDEIRQKTHELEMTAMPIITPHWYNDSKTWAQLFQQFQFFGLNRMNPAGYTDFFTRHMPVLKERKILFHGWGITSAEEIMRWPFYSLDSTSWLGGVRYGTTYKYDGEHRMRLHDYKQKGRRKGWKAECERYDVDFEKFIADDGQEVNKFNCANWVAFSNDMLGYTINSYWLTEEEKGSAIMAARDDWKTDNAVVRHDHQLPIPVQDIEMLQYARFCNTCFMNQKCPVFEANATCRISQRVAVETGHDLADIAKKLIGLQTERVFMAAFAEKINGTPMDEKLSREMGQAIAMMGQLKQMLESQEEVSIRAKGPQSAGILAKIFGGGD